MSRVAPPAAFARAYFAIQAAAGACWWVLVFTVPEVRSATLGELPPIPVAVLDFPLFVVASALVAAGVRAALWVVVPWAVLVAIGLAVYATVTTLAGWGVVLMAAASGLSFGAALLLIFGRVPVERLLIGPFADRTARPASTARHIAVTGLQLAVFWGTFLVVIPIALAFAEDRWRLRLDLGAGPTSGIALSELVVLVLASALGIWSAVAMSSRGAGTPLPADATTRLVVDGPYGIVRNPMAVAGIAQGVAVGLILGSWFVVTYAIAGSLVWNFLVRPTEEAELERRFGQTYRTYRDRVRCWVPRL